MALKESVYILLCDLCGKLNQSHEPVTRCSKCGVLMVVESWGGKRLVASEAEDAGGDSIRKA